MLSVEQRAEIRRAYYVEKKSMRQIARETGHARETVKKALNEIASPNKDDGPLAWRGLSTLDPMAPQQSNDGEEVEEDTDQDGLSDSFEKDFWPDSCPTGPDPSDIPDDCVLNPQDADTDNDGLSDFFEINWDGDPAYTPGLDLNPLAVDTDGDGIPDNQDPEPLLVAIAGDIAPLGSPDGQVNAADYLVCLRAVLGITNPLYSDIQNADLYPSGSPDKTVDLSDLILLQELVMHP